MGNFSLLFARTLQDADDSALLDWKWDKVGDLGHDEYRRPDNGERVRFAPDHISSLQNLRWNTRVYLGRNWTARTDAHQIKAFIGDGFFKEVDPELPPPRERRTKADRMELSDLRRILNKIEGRG